MPEYVDMMSMTDRATGTTRWGLFDAPREMTGLVFSDGDDECPCACGCCKALCTDPAACDGSADVCHCFHTDCECNLQIAIDR